MSLKYEPTSEPLHISVKVGATRPFQLPRFVPQVAGPRRAPLQIEAIETDDLLALFFSITLMPRVEWYKSLEP